MLHSCFPERLKSLRQEKNMLQQDLAEHLKVSKSTVSGWEVGRNQPNYDTLIELSIFFGYIAISVLKATSLLAFCTCFTHAQLRLLPISP